MSLTKSLQLQEVALLDIIDGSSAWDRAQNSGQTRAGTKRGSVCHASHHRFDACGQMAPPFNEPSNLTPLLQGGYFSRQRVGDGVRRITASTRLITPT